MSDELVHHMRGFAEECLCRIAANPETDGNELHTRQTYADIITLCNRVVAPSAQETAGSETQSLSADEIIEVAMKMLENWGHNEGGDHQDSWAYCDCGNLDAKYAATKIRKALKGRYRLTATLSTPPASTESEPYSKDCVEGRCNHAWHPPDFKLAPTAQPSTTRRREIAQKIWDAGDRGNLSPDECIALLTKLEQDAREDERNKMQAQNCSSASCRDEMVWRDAIAKAVKDAREQALREVGEKHVPYLRWDREGDLYDVHCGCGLVLSTNSDDEWIQEWREHILALSPPAGKASESTDDLLTSGSGSGGTDSLASSSRHFAPSEPRASDVLPLQRAATMDESRANTAALLTKRVEPQARLAKAAEMFAARVQERTPEWFRETDTDFAEANAALHAALLSSRGDKEAEIRLDEAKWWHGLLDSGTMAATRSPANDCCKRIAAFEIAIKDAGKSRGER
jgi:hypothetical protein